jgi:hypothetical protein
MHAEHVREKLLRQMELVTLNPIMGYQDPPGEPFLNGMKAIAGDGL